MVISNVQVVTSCSIAALSSVTLFSLGELIRVNSSVQVWRCARAYSVTSELSHRWIKLFLQIKKNRLIIYRAVEISCTTIRDAVTEFAENILTNQSAGGGDLVWDEAQRDEHMTFHPHSRYRSLSRSCFRHHKENVYRTRQKMILFVFNKTLSMADLLVSGQGHLLMDQVHDFSDDATAHPPPPPTFLLCLINECY